MRIRSFIVAYALVLAILLFADRRPSSTEQDRYSQVVDLTDSRNSPPGAESATRIIAPGALIPGTWAAGQIPPERLIAPLVVLDLAATPAGTTPISLDDIAAWEKRHGMIPQGAVVALRRVGALNLNHSSLADVTTHSSMSVSSSPLPIADDAAHFLIDARYTIGFAVETPVNFASDRTLARQLALHGDYVLDRTACLTSLPATGSLIIVAPPKNKKPGEASVRVLAMVK
jgi:kynurenine formamidase